MEKIIVKTSDGSHSIYVAELDEHYHSTHGALQEALHVFIKMGLDYFKESKSELSILEVGFGTGLNTLVTILNQDSLKIKYYGIEAYPVPKNILEQLNYHEEINQKGSKEIFDKIHEVDWENFHLISPNFELIKIEEKIQKVILPEKIDLIYFDAFGPRAQEEMWEEHIFKRLYDCLSPGGILVTYCAKGAVKRNLKGVGFEVESLEGPPGKREMTRAIKR